MKLASSQFDFGYTEQFCIPGVTSVFFSSCDSVFGNLWSSIKQIEAPYMFDSENAIALDTIGPHLAARGKSHGFSRVAAGTWGIFHLRQKTQRPSHIPISEGRLLLRCL